MMFVGFGGKGQEGEGSVSYQLDNGLLLAMLVC